MAKPYTILGVYKPPRRRASIVGPDICQITEELGLVPLRNDEIKRNWNAAWFDYDRHAECRITAVAGSEAEGWHKDGDTSTNDMDFSMVLWTNHTPTQLMDEHGWTYQPQPYEIFVFRNLVVSHRRPPTAAGKRFSFRQRVYNSDYI